MAVCGVTLRREALDVALFMPSWVLRLALRSLGALHTTHFSKPVLIKSLRC